MKTRHYLFWLSVACITSAPAAPLFFDQWEAAVGIHFGLALLLISVAAIMTPDLE